mmetsp:Transcript_52178/g.121774  ORF Transcript_52178/g.121774 Transcript_52178/m.121774 type:complete len:1453 (+) Transcript_52178:53-4411(+)
MAPKKDKKKKDEPTQPELVTAYKAREPLAAVEPPDVSQVDAEWKQLRDQYVLPLPVWNAEVVDTAEWKPNELENAFTSNQFSIFAMPRSFSSQVSGWRRAGASALAKGELLPEEPEPQAQPIPELKEEPTEPAPDPKAKAKPKADTKAKAKAKNQPEEPPEKPTTMQQYADCTYEGEARVVSQAEFRSRELCLDLDDAAPQLSQAIAAQFAAVAEHRLLLPKGYFLWELIHPQDEEGMPLFNPHGKYIVKLFVQGKWRQVVIDDVVPVGYAMHGNNTYASLLPSSNDINIIWPQLLAKALMQAFQDDLNMPILPCITALTGWVPYQLPLSWSALQGLKAVRTFCTLQSTSQVDFEARQRAELMPSIPQAEAAANRKSIAAPASQAISQPPAGPGPEQNLKLGNQPQEALLEFLLCETEDEPRQVRLKADAFVPQHGTPRKQVRDADSEEEDGSADAGNTDGQPVRADEEVDDSDRDDLDEDDDGRSQNTHSGEGEGAEKRTDQGGSVDGEGPEMEQEEELEMSDMPWVAPWPTQNPHPLMMKSSIQEFQSQLQGGSWVSFEEIEATATTFCSYIPPGEHVLTATLDTCWDGDRAQAYLPPKTCLLRICLVLQELEQGATRTRSDTGDSKPTPGPPWLQTVFCYEPLRLNSRLSESAPPAPPCSCVLQAVNTWRPGRSREALDPPDCIDLTVGEGAQPSGVNFSALLPPGEHWYLVSDDAAELAGSVLSVNVEGLLLNATKSTVEFVEPAKAFSKYRTALLPVGPLQYPIHTGYSVWAKSEILISEACADSLHSLQVLCHLTDATLWPYIQLSCWRVSVTDVASDEPPENRCANWSVSPVLKSSLLRVMSLPLAEKAPAGASKYVLLLEANLPPEVLPKSGGEISLQIFGPPGTAPEPEEPAEGGGDGEDGGLEDEVPLQLQMLTVDKVMRWQGECTDNDKGLVLCERITVPADGGDVTSTLRITVEHLPQAFLRATLVAQMPPTDEMRPLNPDGTPLEPLVPGAPINPRDYSGRRNWLSRCKKVAETSGLEIVCFSHVLLAQASTYILYVHLDQFRGPGSLDGGAWTLESFGSGALEVGSDAMEQDLEELVRKSWETSQQEGEAPPRCEKAAETREAWKAKRSGEGYVEEGGSTEEEQKQMEAVLERTREVSHPNNSIAKFLSGHAETPAVLVQEDPYTVAPDRPEWKPAEDTDGIAAEEVVAEDTEVAIKALGTEGEREARQLEMEISTARWETAKETLVAAKERNANQVQELRTWREERSAMPGGVQGTNFAPTRNELRGALHSRMEKCAVLKILCFDGQRLDPEPLRVAFSEADAAGAKNYDPDLMQNGSRKLRVMDASAAFQEGLTAAEAAIEAAATAKTAVQAAEEGSDSQAEAKEAAAAAMAQAAGTAKALADAFSEFKESVREAQAHEIPVPADLLNEERTEKATSLLQQHAAAEAADSADPEPA